MTTKAAGPKLPRKSCIAVPPFKGRDSAFAEIGGGDVLEGRRGVAAAGGASTIPSRQPKAKTRADCACPWHAGAIHPTRADRRAVAVDHPQADARCSGSSWGTETTR